MATHTQSRASASVSASQTLAYTSNVAAGSLLVVHVRESTTTSTDPTLSDTLGNTYILAQRATRAWIFYCKSASGGANTVSLVSTAPAATLCIFEFAGTWDAAPTVTSATSTTDSSSPVTTPSVSPSAANGVTLAGVSTLNASNPFAATSPYTLGPVASNVLALAYDFPTTTTGRTTDITTGAGISGGSYVQHIHIAESGGGGGSSGGGYIGTSLNSFDTFNMPIVIPQNTATAALRRIPFVLVDATDFATPEDITVTGVKASLTFNGGTAANSTNDIVKVDGATGRYYLELTQTEANNALGTVHGTLAPTGCARAYLAAVIGPSTVMDTASTTTQIRDAILNWEPFTGYNLARLLRAMGIVLRGTATGLNTTSATYTAPAGGATVTATVDADGNRSVVSDTASGTP